MHVGKKIFIYQFIAVLGVNVTASFTAIGLYKFIFLEKSLLFFISFLFFEMVDDRACED